jgi:hypothetical protein
MLSMSESHYASEKKKEAPFPIELLVGQTVTQEMTPIEKMISLEASVETSAETSATAPKLPKPETELGQEMHHSPKMMRRKQTSAKIDQLLKQVTRNEIEIHEMRKTIKSLDRMETIAVRTNQQLMKQLRFQLIQLRKQVMRIQIEFSRMRTFPASGMRMRKANVSGNKRTRKVSSRESDSITQAKTKAETKGLKRTRIKTSSK